MPTKKAATAVKDGFDIDYKQAALDLMNGKMPAISFDPGKAAKSAADKVAPIATPISDAVDLRNEQVKINETLAKNP